MKKFLSILTIFSFILVLIIAVGILLPATPRATTSLLFGKKQKDSLLQYIAPPRIIFVGGSNLSFGLNSQMIRDSLKLFPINTSIHLAIGLIYMMDNILPFIRNGDIVVVSPEYNHFYGDFAYGNEELLRTVMDIDFVQLKKLRWKQWINFFPFIPRYAINKFDPTEYYKTESDDIYGVHSFNKYGDGYKHWKLKKINFDADGAIDGNFNFSVLNDLFKFKQQVIAKGAVLFITFPGFQSAAFDNNKSQIMKVESELKKKGFTILGSPERYKMPDSLMFNSSYHLIKKGVDYRTALLIQDLKKAL